MRWRKLLRDVWQHRARSAWVVVAVATSLVAAGALLDTWALVQRATVNGYGASLPVSATLIVDKLDAATLARVRAMPEIAAVRARRSVMAAVRTQGAWQHAMLFALDDYTQASMARLAPLNGAWPPADGTLVIEHSSLEFSGATMGEPVQLRRGLDAAQAPLVLPVAGVVRDVSLAPGWMEHLVYAYVTPATLAQLGAPSSFNELQLRVSDGNADREAVRRTARRASALLRDAGVKVTAIDVPVPGEHVHAAQMNSLLLTQGAFGLLALVVCGFLVVNLVSATLAGQAREIAVMKVLGASRAQIAALYFGQALLLGGVASLIALPLAMFLGRQYAGLKGEMLNLPVDGHAIPAWAIALQVAVGCLLPMLAAALPVRRACAITVGEALRDIGIVAPGGSLALRRAWAPAGWARPLLLSVGNAFRRRQRTLLTVLGLAVAGAVFLGAAGLRVAVQGSVDMLFAAQRYDVVLRLSDSQPASQVEAVASGVEGVTHAEAWRNLRAAFPVKDGEEGEAANEPFTVLGVVPGDGLLRPDALQGRWLLPGDGPGAEPALVVSRVLARQVPALRPGQRVELLVDGKLLRWQVVGLVDTGSQAVAYASRAALDRIAGNPLASSLHVALAPGGAGQRLDTVQRLRDALQQAGMPVAGSQMQIEYRHAIEDHLLMVVEFLGAMAWVMIAVGGMGLASTMGLAVLERTREIGVMRALGARTRDILAIVQVESLVLVALAWLLSLPLSVLAAVQLSDAFGRVMFTVPTHYWPEWRAALEWMAITALLSLVACANAARRATRISAAQALAYE